MAHRRTREHFHGCLLGGAVGDALGAPIEFDSLAEIRAKYGPAGLTDYVPAYGVPCAITDDTQLTLFTAEALLRADNERRLRGSTAPTDHARRAYLRWLHTQASPLRPEAGEPGFLLGVPEVFSRRAPGSTCLSALEAGGEGSLASPTNLSKGCGGVMRAAPVGLVRRSFCDPFAEGAAFAALTHGHPSGYLPAGFLAQLVFELAHGAALKEAITGTLPRLRTYPGHEETLAAVEAALALAARGGPRRPEELEALGGAWVGEEALAIGLTCALVARDFAHGVLLAVNHGGDSDSTGSVAGNLLGLLYGASGIPPAWRARVELGSVIEELAGDLHRHFGEGVPPEQALAPHGRAEDWLKFPGE
ncbi:MAG: ADP-ribosylglycohydrolase family protein [Deltaproteobacteria bacterium]|nr:ADP-ribosylglycohydrolase family protein [Deltaproteobacteria bacterium]